MILALNLSNKLAKASAHYMKLNGPRKHDSVICCVVLNGRKVVSMFGRGIPKQQVLFNTFNKWQVRFNCEH